MLMMVLIVGIVAASARLLVLGDVEWVVIVLRSDIQPFRYQTFL